MSEACLPEGREHAIRPAVTGEDGLGLEQQPPTEDAKLGAGGSASMRGRLLQRRLPGFVAARGIDTRRPGLGEQRRQNFRRLATAKAEAAATLCQVFGDGREALMQPPARS